MAIPVLVERRSHADNRCRTALCFFDTTSTGSWTDSSEMSSADAVFLRKS